MTDAPPIFTPSGIAIVCEACPQPLTPAVTQGRVFNIASATGYVGIIVQPDRGGISVPGWGLLWTCGQLDRNADGYVNGSDSDYYAQCWTLGTVMAEWTGDEWLSGDDFDGFYAAFEKGTP